MSKADPLIRTKLHVPFIRPGLVPRPRLQARVMEGISFPLTLVIAPAGFGKTTLVASSLAGRGMPAAWLSLDKDDNQPDRFLLYLIAALQEAVPAIGHEAARLMEGMQDLTPETLLASLINDLDAANREVVMVLDDYQFISSPAVHEQVAFLLEHCPRTFHLVIATRSDPPFPLTRWRARGQMVELRGADLSFTEPEAASFLNGAMGLRLEANAVKILEERTEGWIAGLQMAALSMRDREDVSKFIQGFSGTNRHILDYLVEEVLASQPPEIQRFLLCTSILERLNAPLCDALLAAGEKPGPNSDEERHPDLPSRSPSIPTLVYLERANLFLVPLDDERTWYRYHHLFADLLLIRLGQTYGEEHLRTLHARAARWYEGNQFPAEAIEHALAAGESDLAARVIERSAGGAWLGGGFYQVLHWIEALPKDLVRSRPWLCIWYAWSRMQAGAMEGIDALIDDAERAARLCPDRSPGPDQVREVELAEQIAALRVTWAGVQHETGKTIEFARYALERPMASSQPASRMARSNVLNVLGFAYYVTGDLAQAEQVYCEARKVTRESDFVMRELLIVHKLAHIYQDLRRLVEGYRLCQEALAELQSRGRQAFFAAGYLYCDLAHLLLEWNRLDEAEQMIAQSARLNELARVPHLTIDTCNAQARFFLAQGDLDDAQAALQQAADLIQKHYCWPEVVSANECYQVRLWLARGEVERAARWAERSRSASSGRHEFLEEVREIAQARVLLAQGLPDEALNLLAGLASAAEAGGRTGRLIEILILKAVALQQMKDAPQAEPILATSLALAEPEGYVRTFLDEGQPVRVMLAHWQAHAAPGRLRDYAARLLSQCEVEPLPDLAALDKAVLDAELIEPLTPRELEVLELICAGDSNQMIADNLVITVKTVKKHTGNILGKLGVTSRGQAMVKARQLGLLPKNN